MLKHQIALALSALCAAAPAWAVTSTFDTDAQGWVALGDSEGPLTWRAAGGNPGGNVFIDDLTTGGVTYFVAPAGYRGNMSAALGSNLTFDLMQEFTGAPAQFDASDVVLIGAGLTLVFNTPNNPANGSWTSYAVPLAAAGWHLNTLAGAAPTADQFASALGSVTALRIRAEYRTGADIGYLDNVNLLTTTAPIPEPGTYALMALGLGALVLATRRRRA